MSRRDVELKRRVYTISQSDPPNAGGRWWGVVQAHLIDELTNEAARGRIVLERAGAGMTSPAAALVTKQKIADDAVVGFVGVPNKVFPALCSRERLDRSPPFRRTSPRRTSATCRCTASRWWLVAARWSA
jgi:hypothetical protein